MRSPIAKRELAHTRSVAEHTLERVRHEAENCVVKGEVQLEMMRSSRTWLPPKLHGGKQSLEALARAEEHWRKNSDETLAAATARFEHSEAELAKLHAEMETERGQDGEGVAHRLRDKIAVLQATLAVRERELAHARLTAETRISPSRPKTFQQRDPERAQQRPPLAQNAPKSSKMPRDVFIVCLLAATIVVQLPRLEGYIPESAWNMIGMTTHPELYKEAPPGKAATTVGGDQAIQPTTTITRGVTCAIRSHEGRRSWSELSRGVQKCPSSDITETGPSVRFGDAKSKVKEGWVYNSFLSSPAGDSIKPSAPKK